jgi:fructose-1,6-bisphosphatase II / sedoheptulose-1,7-bisphosphatase
VAGVMNTTDPSTGVDLYMGSGRRAGRRSGLRGAEVRRRPVPGPPGVPQRRRARPRRPWGITELDKKYDLHEIVRADAIFAATGVTNGALLDGVKVEDGFVHTHTLVLNSASRTAREVRTKRPA